MDRFAQSHRGPLIVSGISSFLVIAAIDFLTPWELGVSSLYLIPVILVGASTRLCWGLATASLTGLLGAWIDFHSGHPFSHPAYRWWDSFNHFLPLLFAIAIIHFLKRALAHEQEANTRLELALSEVRELREILPICAWCGQTRDDQGYWQRLDHYLARTTRTKMTHGICPDCREKLLRESDPTEDTAKRGD